MRTAILSDIHSNLPALSKALSLLERSGVEQLYCLGDIVGYGAQPNECIALLREQNCQSVLGNHDLAALDPRHAQYFTKHGRIAAEWTNTILTQDSKDYLAGLPYVIETDTCTFAHASPAAPDEWEYVQSLPVAQRQFEAFKNRICFIGHTHIPLICGENLRTFVFKNDMRFLIYVGSVGQPRDHNPQLSFGIFDTEAWTYKNIRADYDIQAAAQSILNRGLPTTLAKRLFEGV